MSAATAFAMSAPEFRAAGTDLSERRRSGLSCGSIIDLTASPDTIGITWDGNGSAR
ncbi:molybdopterin dehydrogenase, partial [Streptomyces sp. Alain-F2R5]